MSIRRIVMIDEEKCNGCGICVPGCHEGAIQIFAGKARLVADNLCDGLGDCLRECPLGAISIIQREAQDFDELAVDKRLASLGCKAVPAVPAQSSGNCPGSRIIDYSRPHIPEGEGEVRSELAQWPVQLHLVSPSAPYFQDVELLICADCVPFAYPDFHSELLRGRAVAIACPKLDETGSYARKLAMIIVENNTRSVTVAHMEVPCCSGLVLLAREAIELSGRRVELRDVTLTIRGQVKK